MLDGPSFARSLGRASLLAVISVFATGAPEAAVIDAPSRVGAVTLYPDAAIVRRDVSIELPAGNHEIVLQDLPGALDPASLRVEGQGEGRLVILGVEMRARAGGPEAGRPETLARLAALRAERDRLADRIDASEGRKAMIQRFAQGPEGRDGKPLDLEAWTKAWDLVGKGLQSANEEIRGFRIDLERIEAEIATLEHPHGTTRPGQGPERRVAAIAVEASSAGRITLSVSYRVRGASWRPVYDARLSTSGGAPQLDLVRRAMIRQETGEDWADVTLALSTLQVSRATAAPDLRGQRIAIHEPPPPAPRSMAAPAPGAADAERMLAEPVPGNVVRQKSALASQSPIEEAGARLDAGAYQAEFAIAGKVSLPAGNVERSVRLGAERPEITLSMLAVPVLEPKAYLEVRFSAPGEAALLPGEVILIRDGAFIGRGRLPLVAPGDQARLGFGADDRLVVKRVAIARTAREPGFLGSTRTDEQHFRTIVKNLHGFPVPMRIEDRIPVSEDQIVLVERLADMTKPDIETPDDRRGVFIWTPTLKPEEERAFVTAYRMRWPAGKEIRIVPLPR